MWGLLRLREIAVLKYSLVDMISVGLASAHTLLGIDNLIRPQLLGTDRKDCNWQHLIRSPATGGRDARRKKRIVTVTKRVRTALKGTQGSRGRDSNEEYA